MILCIIYHSYQHYMAWHESCSGGGRILIRKINSFASEFEMPPNHRGKQTADKAKGKRPRSGQDEDNINSAVDCAGSAAEDAAAELDAMESVGSGASGSGARLPNGLLERRLAKSMSEKEILERQLEEVRNELKKARELPSPVPAPKVNV